MRAFLKMVDAPVLLSLEEIYSAEFGAKVRNTFLEFPETPEDSESEDQGKSAQLKLGPKRSFSAPALVAKPAPAEAEIRDRSATWGLPGDRVLMPNELSASDLAVQLGSSQSRRRSLPHL